MRTNQPPSLRDLPYPYGAALALTGDLDDLRSYEQFTSLTRFLCTDEETRHGHGLGLEVAQSFWFYDATGECDFTVFEGAGFELSAHADRIADLIGSGHLDVLHTYGNFSEGGFRREHAERALSFLERRSLKVPVWVNHGGALNAQMIGALPEQRGDDPGAPEYHTDILTRCGIRFVEMFDVVHTVGQDTRPGARDALAMAAESLRYLAAGDRRRAKRALRNRLISRCTLGDGSSFHCFKRFIGKERGMARAGALELARQLAPVVLGELVARRGWMSVYTHPWRGLGPDGALPGETRRALAGLAERSRAGEIYVTTTAKLLGLNVLTRNLVWSHETSGGITTIRIERVDDGVTGPRVPTLQELQGVTFYVSVPERTRVVVGGEEATDVVANAPDETGVASLSFPITRLPAPRL